MKYSYSNSLALQEQTKNFKIRLHAIEIIGITLGTLEYSSPVRIRTGQLEDVYHVNLPIHGDIQLKCGDQRVLASPRRAGIHGPDDTAAIHGWHNSAQLLALKIPKTIIDRELTLLLGQEPNQTVVFSGSLELRTQAAQQWLGSLKLLSQSLYSSTAPLANPLVAETAALTMVRGLLLVAENNYLSALTGHPPDLGLSYIKHAKEFIETNADKPLTVGEIAAAAHVSTRSLQMAFRKHLDTTPMEMLRQVRMKRARKELQQALPSTRIEDIAAKWHFFQPGRFAVQYTKTFGESPSETRNQSFTQK